MSVEKIKQLSYGVARVDNGVVVEKQYKRTVAFWNSTIVPACEAWIPRAGDIHGVGVGCDEKASGFGRRVVDYDDLRLVATGCRKRVKAIPQNVVALVCDDNY